MNVALSSEDELLGAVSTADGVYIISGVPPGEYVLRASFVGFETFTDTLQFAAGVSRHIDIAMNEEQLEIGEIVVESEREPGAARVVADLILRMLGRNSAPKTQLQLRTELGVRNQVLTNTLRRLQAQQKVTRTNGR